MTVRIDNLAGDQTSITRTVIHALSIPLPYVGYDPEGGTNHSKHHKGKIERITDYHFQSGQHLKVTQEIHEFDGQSLEMDVLFEGEIPEGDEVG